jgi:hypothetical protein
MRMIDLMGKGYNPILNLPSYVVLQHPNTFHTVFYEIRMKKEPKVISQYNIPGLSNDPSVEIPSMMWKEWVAVTGGKKQTRRDGDEGAPTPRRNAQLSRSWFRNLPTAPEENPLDNELPIQERIPSTNPPNLRFNLPENYIFHGYATDTTAMDNNEPVPEPPTPRRD